MDSNARGSWSGHLGFVLAAAGSAIGLGNIWRFPYTAGAGGGGAFVLVYLGAVLLVGVPILVSEVVLGRATQRNPVGAFRAASGTGGWPLVGYIGVIAGFVILSYYGVVAGWALNYLVTAASGGLSGMDSVQMQSMFEDLTSSPYRQVAWQALFMVATILVVSRGIEAGIERASKVLMPLLLGFLLVLLGYALTSEKAMEGLSFFLEPRFEDLTWTSVLAALGQAFFSLSLGMGAMITYGSYLERRRSVARPVMTIVAMDTSIAILAGLVIFPLVATYSLDPSSGPGLVFVVLPQAFLRMPATSLLAALFFGLLVFAALTSAISLLEVVVAFAVDELRWTRGFASWVGGGLIFALGVPSAVSSGFFGWADRVASEVMLPAGGFFIALFVAWVMPVDVAKEGYRGREGGLRWYSQWRFCLRYVAPVAVAIILLQNIGLLD